MRRKVPGVVLLVLLLDVGLTFAMSRDGTASCGGYLSMNRGLQEAQFVAVGAGLIAITSTLCGRFLRRRLVRIQNRRYRVIAAILAGILLAIAAVSWVLISLALVWLAAIYWGYWV